MSAPISQVLNFTKFSMRNWCVDRDERREDPIKIFTNSKMYILGKKHKLEFVDERTKFRVLNFTKVKFFLDLSGGHSALLQHHDFLDE